MLRLRLSLGVWNGAAGECKTNGVDGAQSPAAGGFDGGADVGVELGSPFGTEAVGDLAIDRAGLSIGVED